MARKKKHEEHENHERWLVSYADFITLLFAFFVVMYALSSVNEGKYRVLSDAMISAFNAPPKSIEPIQIGDPIKAPQDLMQDILSPTNAMKPIQMPSRQKVQVEADGSKDSSDKKNLNKIADRLEMALSKMIERDLIKVHKNDNWIEVEINTSILFNSGSALLQPQALPVLTEIARILRDFPNAIRVEGYTDNIPIDTAIYPSNWELSAGRAASVVHLFSDERVDPFRMSAIGYGEYRPAAANTTPEGRNANRRVVVLILSETADKLFDRGAVTTLRGGEQPVRDVNLDASLPIIEEVKRPGTNDKPIPEGFPGGLPLLNRQSVPATGASKAQMNQLLEDISAPVPSGAQTNPAPAAPPRGGQ
jgi:chemotaxis protein MotB